MKYPSFLLIFILSALLISCRDKPGTNANSTGELPGIIPDYNGIKIPFNIAPLNFRITIPGSAFHVKIRSESGDEINITSGNGKIIIPERKWKLFAGNNKGKEFSIEVFVKDSENNWSKYEKILNSFAPENIDPYLYYRLLYPGYESWSELSINMRNLSDFRTKTIIKNRVAEDNCVNCHSFNNGKTGDFLFHIRGSLGGTVFYSENDFRKVNLKTREMKNGAVYPRWHPSGRYVAFSANKIIQRFHSADNKKVEVSDLESSLVLYDVEKNEMTDIHIQGSENSMDTYPEWSPDGKYLYFCRTSQIGEDYDYTDIRYNLYRIPFDPDMKSTGSPELIFKADSMEKSVAFPRVSPDGKLLVFTLADYGCFPIWHKEADLWSVSLSDLKTSRLDLNSDFTDSYHSWSSNGKWIVFSSKRDDGLTARPYISYIDQSGKASKPFILPQKDPDFYSSYLKSFNIPEFASVEVRTTPGKMRKTVFSGAVQAKWSSGFLTLLRKNK